MRTHPADFGDFLSAYEEAYFQPSYEGLRGLLSEDYRDAPPHKLERVLRENVGDVPLEAMEDFLGTLAQIGQAALPVLLPAVGTVIGGPVGGVIGGVAGQAASGAIAAATAKKPQGAAPATKKKAAPKKAAPKKAAPPRVAPPAAPTVTPPAAQPVTQAAAIVPAAPVASTAAAQLLNLVHRPEFMQALGSMMLGSAGRDQIPVGDGEVPTGAFANLLSVLADQLAAGQHALVQPQSEGVPGYLVESDGDYKCDITVPEERAQVLWDLLHEADDEGGEWEDPYGMGFAQPGASDWRSMHEQLYDPYAFAGLYGDGDGEY